MAFAHEITSKSEIDEIMKEGGPAVMIDFWASWCGPCRMMAPHFEAVAEAMADEPVKLMKLDTETHSEIAAAFNVRSLPTVLLIWDGKIQDVVIGAKDAGTLKKKAEWLLSKSRGDGFFKRMFG